MIEHTAFIGLGSNLNDRFAYLSAARMALTEEVHIERASSVYETEPVEVTDQPWFLNQVLLVTCTQTPIELLELCLAIEEKMGRRRLVPKGPRTIDLDLLLYDDLVLNEEREGCSLIIPHPRMHLRKFVLAPLCEVAPWLVHPVLGGTIAQLLAVVDDPAQVSLYSPP
jgi:2-amino-4-hydroxy-6-hydroxymethyldihydropteridine diphosphokinase